MDLYRLHRDAAKLYKHGEKVSFSPYHAFKHAMDIGKRFPEGEAAIAKDPERALHYAGTILRGRFPEGEALIAKDAYISLRYAMSAICGPFPAGEAAIAKIGSLSIEYAKLVLKRPFPAGEAAIADDKAYSRDYLERVLKGDANKATNSALRKRYINMGYEISQTAD